MVETLVRPDQRTDAVSIGGSPRARTWTLTVACMGVALVVASMTALNTALGDLAVATSATPVTAELDRRRLHRGAGVPAATRRSDRRPLRQARCPADRFGGFLGRLDGTGDVAQPGANHRGPRGGRDRGRICDARDAVTADRGLSERRSHEGRWYLGRHGRFRRRPGHAWFWPAASLLGLARDLLVTGRRRAGDFRSGVHRRIVARHQRSADRFAGRGPDRRGGCDRRSRNPGSTQPRME